MVDPQNISLMNRSSPKRDMWNVASACSMQGMVIPASHWPIDTHGAPSPLSLLPFAE